MARFLSPPVIVLLLAAPLLAFGQNRQTKVVFEETPAEPDRLQYLLSLPTGYKAENSEKKWPLLIFLHGAGERGDDIEKVKVHGPPKLIEKGQALPFIVVSPQCPKNGWWTDQPLMELLDDLEKRYWVDKDRIYLTGLSMGGYGSWYFASRHPDRFAAVAPICGGGVPYLTRNLAKTPIWAFHGAKDVVVPLEESTRLVKLLQKRGNKDVKLTVFPEAGHDSWTQAYAMEELFDWFLAQKRQK